MPLVRRIGNKFFSGLIYCLTNVKVVDPSSGIRIFKKEILSHSLYPLPHGLNFIIVMTTKLLFEDLCCKEHPIPYDERHGSSKLSVIQDGLRFLNSVLAVIALNNPFTMYFLGTSLAAVLCVLSAYPAIAGYIRSGSFPVDTINWMITSAFFANVSFLCYTVGVIATSINQLVFDKRAPRTVLSRYLTDPRLTSRFGLASMILLNLSLLIYIGLKADWIPNHSSSMFLLTTCGFVGLMLGTAHYLIRHIEKHIKERSKPAYLREPITKPVDSEGIQ